MFGKLKVQLRNALQFVDLSEACLVNKQFVQLRTGFTGAQSNFELQTGQYSYYDADFVWGVGGRSTEQVCFSEGLKFEKAEIIF